MVSGFTVDPAALRTTARSLVVLCAYWDNTTVAAGSVDSGQQQLNEATRDFATHWEWQAKRIGTSLQDMSDRLKQAADQYQAVEAAQLRAEGRV